MNQESETLYFQVFRNLYLKKKIFGYLRLNNISGDVLDFRYMDPNSRYKFYDKSLQPEWCIKTKNFNLLYEKLKFYKENPDSNKFSLNHKNILAFMSFNSDYNVFRRIYDLNPNTFHQASIYYQNTKRQESYLFNIACSVPKNFQIIEFLYTKRKYFFYTTNALIQAINSYAIVDSFANRFVRFSTVIEKTKSNEPKVYDLRIIKFLWKLFKYRLYNSKEQFTLILKKVVSTSDIDVLKFFFEEIELPMYVYKLDLIHDAAVGHNEVSLKYLCEKGIGQCQIGTLDKVCGIPSKSNIIKCLVNNTTVKATYKGLGKLLFNGGSVENMELLSKTYGLSMNPLESSESKFKKIFDGCSLEMCKYLHREYPSFFKLEKDLLNYLNNSVKNGNMEVVKYLLFQVIDIENEKTDRFKYIVAPFAVKCSLKLGSTQDVVNLLKRYNLISFATNTAEEIKLIIDCSLRNGHVLFANWILHSHPNLANGGDYSLYHMARNGYFDEVKFIIQNNLPYYISHEIIYISMVNSKLDVCRYLLEYTSLAYHYKLLVTMFCRNDEDSLKLLLCHRDKLVHSTYPPNSPTILSQFKFLLENRKNETFGYKIEGNRFMIKSNRKINQNYQLEEFASILNYELFVGLSRDEDPFEQINFMIDNQIPFKATSLEPFLRHFARENEIDYLKKISFSIYSYQDKGTLSGIETGIMDYYLKDLHMGEIPLTNQHILEFLVDYNIVDFNTFFNYVIKSPKIAYFKMLNKSFPKELSMRADELLQKISSRVDANQTMIRYLDKYNFIEKNPIVCAEVELINALKESNIQKILKIKESLTPEQLDIVATNLKNDQRFVTNDLTSYSVKYWKDIWEFLSPYRTNTNEVHLHNLEALPVQDRFSSKLFKAIEKEILPLLQEKKSILHRMDNKVPGSSFSHLFPSLDREVLFIIAKRVLEVKFIDFYTEYGSNYLSHESDEWLNIDIGAGNYMKVDIKECLITVTDTSLDTETAIYIDTCKGFYCPVYKSLGYIKPKTCGNILTQTFHVQLGREDISCYDSYSSSIKIDSPALKVKLKSLLLTSLIDVIKLKINQI